MLLIKPIHCLLLTFLLVGTGCNNGGTDANTVDQPAEIEVSTHGEGNSSPSPSNDVMDIEPADSDMPIEPSSEPDPPVDDSPLSTPAEADNEAVPVHTFELSLDQGRAALDEGKRDGTTIVVGVSPDGDEGIELKLEPENSVDGRGIDVFLNQQRLDSQNRSTAVTFTMPIDMHPRLEHQRRFVLTATSGDETRSRTITLDIKPVNAPDVYLLIGQSNMVGSSEVGAKKLTSGGEDEQDRRIWQLNVSHNDKNLYSSLLDFGRDDRIAIEPRFVQAQDPLHEPLRGDKDEKGGTKVGLGMSFARSALGDTTQKIYLVPAAWGGSGFCDELGKQLAWNAEATDNTSLGGTGLIERAIARLNLTLRDTGGVLRGILWHQGEADSGRRACADSYAQNLVHLAERIRTDATEDARGKSARGPQAPIPFIVGTMSKGDDARGDFSRWSDTKEKVDGVHRQVVELIPFADWVNNDDLVPPAYPCGSGSCVHFGSLAVREMGQRFYHALERVWERQ